MRKALCIALCFTAAVIVYAGDVAHFVNIGFSADGSRFVFGQHGITDGDYRAYADIYCVDVPTNRFIPGGTFSTAPTAATAGKDGTEVFTELRGNMETYLKKLEVNGEKNGRALYVQAREEKRPDRLEFRDFETGRVFTVSMHSFAEGSGSSVRSSFYLVLEIVQADGKTDRHTIGLPGYKRAGVKDYRIRRVVTDDGGSAIVFVIEKILVDNRGESVRFMVETIKL